MKLINKFGILLCAASALTACNDECEYDGSGKWDAADGYQNVTFVETEVEEELDPADACSATFQVKRTNVGKAATVPFVITENTDSVFSITNQATFGENDSIAEFTVAFPAAEIGTPYTLKLQISDPNYTSCYSQDNTFTYTVSRAKWNLLGEGTFADNFWFEEVSEVQIYVKDGDPTTYRVSHPFDSMYGGLDGNQSANVTLHILQNGETYMGVDIDKDDLVYFTTMNTGYYYTSYGADVKLYHPFDLYSNPTSDLAAYSKVLYYQSDDVTPGQIALAPYYYMDGVGGWNNTTNPTAVVITFPGFTPPYEASILNDFDWEEAMSDAQFGSGMLDAAATVTMYKGTCNTDSCGCDTVFAQNYGTPYAIASPYADGYNIYFCLKDGNIVVPSEVALQNTGLVDPTGAAVYAKINTDVSSFSDKVVTLNITFQNEDGTIIYGTNDETLSQITWSQVGTVDYVYTLFFGEEYDDNGDCTKPYYDNGLTLLQRDDDPTQFKVEHWGYDVDFYFTLDQETNEITIPEQYTGYTDNTYGDVMVADLAVYANDESYYSYYPCTYDAETNTATVNVIYYVSAGNFGYGPETFKINWNSDGVKGHRMAAKATKPSVTKKLFLSHKLHKANRFKGTRAIKGQLHANSKLSVVIPRMF